MFFYDFDFNEIELLEDLFGEVLFFDNCLGVIGIENVLVININDCGVGMILCFFMVMDVGGLIFGIC